MLQKDLTQSFKSKKISKETFLHMFQKITLHSQKNNLKHSKDEIFHILKNCRRRYVLKYLKDIQTKANLRELSKKVAAWEYDLTINQLNSKQIKRVYTSLHQSHLPKMNQLGIIDYDKKSKTIQLRDMDDFQIFLEIVPEGEIPWSEYYIGLSAVSLALITSVYLLNTFPFNLINPINAAIIVITLYTTSSLIHYYNQQKNSI